MSTITKSRRRQQRHVVTGGHGAVVEFDYPNPNGRTYRVPVVNLSASGVSFSIRAEQHRELFGLEEGANLAGAVLRIGGCMVRGDLVVMHITDVNESERKCGALLYPDSDNDLVKLKSVIAGMEAVESE